MDLRQACILMLTGMIFLPFIAQLIEEIIKEHINKNKSIKKTKLELERAYIEMVRAEQYRIYKKINKMQFLSCTIK